MSLSTLYQGDRMNVIEKMEVIRILLDLEDGSDYDEIQAIRDLLIELAQLRTEIEIREI